MAGQTIKKAANTAAMKFNEIKKTFNESLIWIHISIVFIMSRN